GRRLHRRRVANDSPGRQGGGPGPADPRRRARAVRRSASRRRARRGIGRPSPPRRSSRDRGPRPVGNGRRDPSRHGLVDALEAGAGARHDRGGRAGCGRDGREPGNLQHGVASGGGGARMPRLGTDRRRNADRDHAERRGLARAVGGGRIARGRETRGPRLARRSRRPAPHLSLGREPRRLRHSRWTCRLGGGVTDFSRMTIHDFLDELASSAPTPGGGTAAAVAGAMGAGLAEMVAALTLSKEKYAAAHAAIRPVSAAAGAARDELLRLAREDSEAYDDVVAARRLPKESGEEKAAREKNLAAANLRATEVPLSTARSAARLLEALPELAEKGNPNAASDVGAAAILLEAAVQGALLNVAI